MKNPLLVNALELLRRPGSVKRITIEVDPLDIGLESRVLASGSPLEVDVSVESLSDGLVVTGSLRARFAAECRRCLCPIEGIVEADVRELYQVTVTDPDAFPIVGDQVDLVPMVRESVLLELPDAPVCRPDCAGLCPICGIDRNVASCTCVVDTPDPRWAALEGLREQLPE
ncbi:MAG: YceD family protein [Ilumatobacteraceae bacterium]